MNISQFSISLNEARDLYSRIGLLKMNGPKEIYKNGVTDKFKEAALGKDFLAAYRVGIENLDYDYLLIDNSFFQFSISFEDHIISEVNYSFYNNPSHFVTYSEFTDLLVRDNIFSEEEITELEDYLLDDYDQFLNEQKLLSSSTLIRYDYDIPNYRQLIHPASHFHIGNKNSVRIPCSKLITPYQFSLFILRHVYYDYWVKLLAGLEDHNMLFKKNLCSELKNNLWNDIEKNDLYIT